MGADATDTSETDASDALERVFALFPRLVERVTARRHAVRRRAADAGDRPRAYEPSAPAVARRAIARPLAADGAPDFRRDPRPEPQDGLTVLIVEQNANHALRLAHRGYVMVNGLITLREPAASSAAPRNALRLSGRRPAGLTARCAQDAAKRRDMPENCR